LSGGITDVKGDFGVGSPVHIVDIQGRHLAAGLVNYSSAEIRRIMGCKSCQIGDRLGHKSYDEVIHRNNMTLLV
jgi:glutamate 5-kinase